MRREAQDSSSSCDCGCGIRQGFDPTRYGLEKRERRGERRREERFVKIVEFSLWISSGVIPTRCLGKEPLKFRGFRDEKRRRKVVKHLGIGVGNRASQFAPKESLNLHPWGAARPRPASEC
uniref:Uncharacterized protein n=1 Tax=Solanum tuberosum TaxID=4113 RepID=M1DKD5_SOLTU